MSILLMINIESPTLIRIFEDMLYSLKIDNIVVHTCDDAWETISNNKITDIIIDVSLVCECKSNFKNLDDFNIIILGDIGLSCKHCYPGFDKILEKPFIKEDLMNLLNLS